jgi:uncharacterized protein
MFEAYTLGSLIVMGLAATLAGCVDAMIGGGGLIQQPALLVSLPNRPIPSIFGTNKVAAFFGTSVAAFQYSKRINYNFWLLLFMGALAFVASILGAKALLFLPKQQLKPFILVILIGLALFTFFKKELGSGSMNSQLQHVNTYLKGALVAVVVGFYDGFFGPGTGSFLVMGMVLLMGFDFLHASAYAKVVNCLTNIGAVGVFSLKSGIYWDLALLLAACQMLGGFFGARWALKYGNKLIRIVFLVVVTGLIARFGYDVFFGN